MVAVVEMLLLIILNESHMFRLVTTSLRQHGDIKSSKPVEKQKSLELFATQNLRRKDTDLQNTFAAKSGAAWRDLNKRFESATNHNAEF